MFSICVFIDDQPDHFVLHVPVKFQGRGRRGIAVRIPAVQDDQCLPSTPRAVHRYSSLTARERLAHIVHILQTCTSAQIN